MRRFTFLVAISFCILTGSNGFAQNCCSTGCTVGSSVQPVNQFGQGQIVTQSSYTSYSQPAQSYAPVYSGSSYAQPVYSQNVYSQPVYTQPVYQQSYSQPAYQTSPAYYSGAISNAPTYPTTYNVVNSSQPVYSNSNYPTTYNTTSIPTSTYTSSSTSYTNSTPIYSNSSLGTYATYRSAAAATTTLPQYTTTAARSSGTSGLAQSKAQRMAQMNLRGHLGGGFGGARYEGVGWSNVSPQAAIERCCYWGQRAPAQIGVSKGNDGCWYACVLYN